MSAAAYNCGEGDPTQGDRGVRGAMRRWARATGRNAQEATFDDIYPYLPWETKVYVYRVTSYYKGAEISGAPTRPQAPVPSVVPAVTTTQPIPEPAAVAPAPGPPAAPALPATPETPLPTPRVPVPSATPPAAQAEPPVVEPSVAQAPQPQVPVTTPAEVPVPTETPAPAADVTRYTTQTGDTARN